MIRRRFTFSIALCIAVAGLVLSGCTTTNGVTLPPLPAWQLPSDARPITGHEAATAIRALRPGIEVHYADAEYTRVSRTWLDRYLKWTWEAALVADFAYVAEIRDCDDFTRAFDFFATCAAKKAGGRAVPLIARLVVSAPNNGRHALAGVATDEGIFIVEPQPNTGARVTPLAEFRPRIFSAILSDYNPPAQ